MQWMCVRECTVADSRPLPASSSARELPLSLSSESGTRVRTGSHDVGYDQLHIQDLIT